MAKNWTIAEAVQAFKENDKSAIMDIGKRMPAVADLISRTVTGCPDAAVELLGAMPERVTANIVNGALKDGVAEYEDDGSASEEKKSSDKPASGGKEKKAAPAKGERISGDYESVGAYPLYLECKARNLEVKSKQEKSVYIAALEADDKKGSKKSGGKSAGDEYDGKSAKDLYNLCKERKIKAEIKKPADHYAKLLREDDKKNEDGGWDGEDDSSGGDDDDWNI